MKTYTLDEAILQIRNAASEIKQEPANEKHDDTLREELGKICDGFGINKDAISEGMIEVIIRQMQTIAEEKKVK